MAAAIAPHESTTESSTESTTESSTESATLAPLDSPRFTVSGLRREIVREGVLAGLPVIGACANAGRHCLSELGDGAAVLGASEILAAVMRELLGTRAQWVRITVGTGEFSEAQTGELARFVGLVHDHGVRVTIETAGAQLVQLSAGADLVTIYAAFGVQGVPLPRAAAVVGADVLLADVRTIADIAALEGLLEHCRPQGDVLVRARAAHAGFESTLREACMRTGWRVCPTIHPQEVR